MPSGGRSEDQQLAIGICFDIFIQIFFHPNMAGFPFWNAHPRVNCAIEMLR